jgi:serine acetyltransferase
VVLDDVPEGALAVGIPARVVQKQEKPRKMSSKNGRIKEKG